MTSQGPSVVVIPARRASTRLPGKLLLDAGGRPLLAHTIGRCLEAMAPDAVVVAADGPEIAAVAEAAGARAVLTAPELPTGSDRVWAAVRTLGGARHIVNVQGDEPEIEPGAVDAVFRALAAGAEVATLSAPFPPGTDPADPAAVKVVTGCDGQALYFSRSLIPHPRAAGAAEPRLHVGIYGYTRAALERFAAHPPTPLEQAEGLEQLRFLECGEIVQTLPWPRAFPGIDTRSDYEAFLDRNSQRT